MNIKKIPSIAIPIVLCLIVVSLLIVSQITVKATNGFTYCTSNSSALASTTKNFGNVFATSTILYMTAGTGTTTVTCNTGSADQIGFNIIFNASSTAAQLNWRYEYSANATDWYAADTSLNSVPATTTTAVRTFADTNWIYASSTAGTSVSASAYKHVDLLNIASPYVRAVYYVPSGASPASVNIQGIVKSNNVN